MEPIDFLNQDLIRERGLAELYAKALSMNKTPWMAPKLQELCQAKLKHIALLSKKIAEIGGLPSLEAHPYANPGDTKSLLGSMWQWERELYLQYLEQLDDAEDSLLKKTISDLTRDQKLNIEQLKSIMQRI